MLLSWRREIRTLSDVYVNVKRSEARNGIPVPSAQSSLRADDGIQLYVYVKGR
jgi:hypothetical protein